jgi:peptidoglycan/xylan/chitin deacetylase (PgdA/CDA1 family)
MSVSGRLRTLAGRLAGRHRSPGIVLMYHRVASDLVDPWRLCVSPVNFVAQLEVLASRFRVVTLRELVAARGSDGARPSVAITFDDGYADNLHQAARLLAAQGLPATFFLTSGMLGSAREFWWDELDQLLLQPGALPARLDLTLGDGHRAIETGPAAAPLADPQSTAAACVPWEAADGTRVGLLYAVWNSLRALDDVARRAALDDLGRQVGVTGSRRDSHRTLTRDEACELARLPGVEIGAHSVTHVSLPDRTAAEQLRQMQESRRDLESMVDRPVTGFAYPFGDISRRTLQLAESAGFDYACTTEAGCVDRATRPHRIPRIVAEDWPAERFAQRLAEVLQ